ncbi:hypothetical protein ILUMI_04386 [Ignelater luminosus]|uniref:Zinc finger BED domain-containing protein 5 n=1 Tax=Ignelater luminosus TaxID=2038154 RepID=A0A8K0DEK2_IGNLU|nr:hypothetical protein ILUMI_04386 [Ignelater luminosus]
MKMWIGTDAITIQQGHEENDIQTAASSKFNIKEQVSHTNRPKGKYDESYLNFGFTSTGNSDAPDAICVLCHKILANSSLAPAKLRRHFETIHSDHQGKDLHFFKRQRDSLEKSKHQMITIAKTENENATEAYYRVSYRIALNGEAHTIGETLIKPCVKDIVSCVINEQTAKKIDAVQLSNNTLIHRLELCSEYALQMDESTDVAGLAVLLVFVRYPFDKSIEEDLLMCAYLNEKTTREDIFNSMVGNMKGVVSRIQQVAERATNSHCILHRQALVTKKMPTTLKIVMDEAVKMINYIKSRSLQFRLFKILCDEMGSEHKALLLHTEVRWLSRGKALTRLYELRSELFFKAQNNKEKFIELLSNPSWLMNLAYLADIFTKCNEVNLSLQGKSVTVFNTRDKIASFERKLQFWMSTLEQNNFACFPILHECFTEINFEVDGEVSKVFLEHLNDLKASLLQYFPKTCKDDFWVQNPFSVTAKPAGLSENEYEDLIELICDSDLKQKFKDQPLNDFWANLSEEYSGLSKQAIIVLLPFTTTYLCEAGFSYYAATKTKSRNRLDATPDIRIQLSNVVPDIKKICSSRIQNHRSH